MTYIRQETQRPPAFSPSLSQNSGSHETPGLRRCRRNAADRAERGAKRARHKKRPVGEKDAMQLTVLLRSCLATFETSRYPSWKGPFWSEVQDLDRSVRCFVCVVLTGSCHSLPLLLFKMPSQNVL